MTKYKGKILFMALLLIALAVSTAQADWEVEQIESIYDDGMITETGGKFFETSWVEIKGSSIGINSYFAFRGVTIPADAQIISAYLEFTAPFPWNFNQSLDATVYGLKVGDLPSWNPTPDLNSEIQTTTNTVFDIDPLISSAQFNVTVTDIVREIYELYSWESNNDMGFKISSVPVSGGVRYQEAYDSNPGSSLKLYVNYTASDADTWYYKGYTINELFSTGKDVTFSWSDVTNDTYRITSIDETDYLTSGIDSGRVQSPDDIVSVGSDIYMVFSHLTGAYNRTLRKSSDRGKTWTVVGNVSLADTQEYSKIHALAYDQNDTIHIAYASVDFDTYYINFTISTEVMSTGIEIYNGGINIGSHRAFWDPVNNAIWFTRFGGAPGNSARRSRVIRKISGGAGWETYAQTLTDMRDSDLTWANGSMYWSVFQYDGSPVNRWIRLYELGNYSDITDWLNVGGLAGGLNNYREHDIGTWNDDPVLSMERFAADPQTYQLRWDGVAWDTWLYELVNYAPATKPTTSDPKMFYNSDGDLWMGLLVNQDSGDSLIFKDWDDYLHNESVPPTVIAKSTGHVMDWLGGDMFPYGMGVSSWNVTTPINGTDPNPDCLALAVTLEDVQACIDAVVGQTSDDPNPPGTTYPPDGFGEITRFNVRFMLWATGLVLIFAPMILMAWRQFTIKIYLLFILSMVLGFALQWTLGSI